MVLSFAIVASCTYRRNTLKSKIDEATAVSFTQIGYDNHGDVVRGDVVVIVTDEATGARNVAMFNTLKDMVSADGHPAGKPDYGVVPNVIPSSPLYYYYRTSGMIGRGSEWYVVPNAFRSWMLTMGTPTHSNYIRQPDGSVTLVPKTQ